MLRHLHRCAEVDQLLLHIKAQPPALGRSAVHLLAPLGGLSLQPAMLWYLSICCVRPLVDVLSHALDCCAVQTHTNCSEADAASRTVCAEDAIPLKACSGDRADRRSSWSMLAAVQASSPAIAHPGQASCLSCAACTGTQELLQQLAVEVCVRKSLWIGRIGCQVLVSQQLGVTEDSWLRGCSLQAGRQVMHVQLQA